MEHNDTINLLKECDAGSKMAVASIDELTDRIRNPRMRELMEESRRHHEKLGNELHEKLLEHQSCDKDPNLMAKSMSWMKTNMKMAVNGDDADAAGLLTDGCDMGIKSLCKYLNKYKAADETSRDICQRLISIEDTFRKDLRAYL